MSDIYLGNTEIEKAYIGDTLIYEKGGGDSGGGDSGGGSSDDYEPLFFTGANEYEAPLGEKNLLIYIYNDYMLTTSQTIKVINSSTSKYFTYSIPRGKTYRFICNKKSNTVYVCTGTSTTIT